MMCTEQGMVWVTVSSPGMGIGYLDELSFELSIESRAALVKALRNVEDPGFDDCLLEFSRKAQNLSYATLVVTIEQFLELAPPNVSGGVVVGMFRRLARHAFHSPQSLRVICRQCKAHVSKECGHFSLYGTEGDDDRIEIDLMSLGAFVGEEHHKYLRGMGPVRIRALNHIIAQL